MELLRNLRQLETTGLLRSSPHCHPSGSSGRAKDPTLGLSKSLFELPENPSFPGQRSLKQTMLGLKKPLLSSGQLAVQLGAPAPFCQRGGALDPPLLSWHPPGSLKDSEPAR